MGMAIESFTGSDSICRPSAVCSFRRTPYGKTFGAVDREIQFVAPQDVEACIERIRGNSQTRMRSYTRRPRFRFPDREPRDPFSRRCSYGVVQFWTAVRLDGQQVRACGEGRQSNECGTAQGVGPNDLLASVI